MIFIDQTETTRHELAHARAWDQDQLIDEVERRGAASLAEQDLIVDYYRIGYRLAWPLPIAIRPDGFPAAIPGIPRYPWLTWIGWQLEERWAALHNAGHPELIDELCRLDGWSSFVADDGRAGLNTASVAMWLIRGLESPAATAEQRARLTEISERLITESLVPRYLRERDEPDLSMIRTLQNIRLIPLFTSGRLAAMIDHPGLDIVHDLATDAVRLWLDARKDGYTEGVAYDGYLIEHLLNWLAVVPDAEASEEIHRAARRWVSTTVPDRPGIQAPLGDIEPEMAHWLTVIAAVAKEAGDPDLAAWCRTVPLRELPSAALTHLSSPVAGGAASAVLAGGQQQAAVALRTRLDDHAGGGDLLVAISAPRMEIGHLHSDAGQVVLGWRGTCWITDPGYQQYRAGEERAFTLDPQAHNVPVIDGTAQTRKQTVIERQTPSSAVINLSDCYEGEPSVRRTVRIAGTDGPTGTAVLVRDEIEGSAGGVLTHWLVPGQLSWQFVGGWARLADDHDSALWFGRIGGELAADQLTRHPGSRGPLTLTVPTLAGRTDWIFVLDPKAGWMLPDAARVAELIKEEQ